MKNYWSCTKFANWLRGTEKLYAGSGKEWKQWEAEAKAKHPLRYWLAEEALDKVQDFIYWPVEKLYSAKYYTVNRWIDQSHALVAHPKHIKPGKWQDLDYRILHCTFDELVDFVEIEKAYSNYRWDEEKVKNLKWWQGGRWRTRTWRSAEAGLNHLLWESNLNDEEIPTSQSVAAQEIIYLYNWWVNIRPNRAKPMEASGWSAYCDSKGGDLLDMFDRDDGVDTKPMHDKMRELEKQYDDEDTEMLIRLIKIRGYLWT